MSTNPCKSKAMQRSAKSNTNEISERALWLSHLDECKRALNTPTIAELADKLDYRRQEIDRFVNGGEDELPADSLRAKLMWALRDTDRVSTDTRKLLSRLLQWSRGKNQEEMREYWLEKLSSISAKYSLSSDAQVAKFLGISRQALSKFKTGASHLPSLGTQAQIMNLESMTAITDQIWDLFPAKQAEKLKAANLRSAAYLRSRNKAKI